MENWIWVPIVFSLLLGGAVVWFWLGRRKPAESPFLLLQQQLDGLRSEMRSQTQNQMDLLQKSQQGIGIRLDNASKFFGGMESKIAKMEAATLQVLGLGKDIAELQQILKAPKLRGNFSEELLGDLLGQMLPQETFSLQHTFSNGERVDAVIKTAQRLVPVDAKFPLENFRRLVEIRQKNEVPLRWGGVGGESEDLSSNFSAEGGSASGGSEREFTSRERNEERKTLRRQFAADVKKHVDDISKKYILPSEGTFEFALMYIPAENVYYEVITRDLASAENSSLIQYALKKKVIPVSPNTFFAYLQTILLGLRGMQVQSRVREILSELGRIHRELESFRGDFSKLGKHLNDAQSSFSRSEKRLGRLEGKMESLELGPPPREDVESLPPPAELL